MHYCCIIQVRNLKITVNKDVGDLLVGVFSQYLAEHLLIILVIVIFTRTTLRFTIYVS